MESQIIKEDSNLCACPDTLVLAATPFWTICYKCGRAIDIQIWGNWQMVDATKNTNHFAFGLRRDDRGELAGKPNDYFEPEVITVLNRWAASNGESAMNILNRLKKIEAEILPAPPCFCGKTLLDLWYGNTDADSLTYCRNCKPQYDSWANLVAEAVKNENLTDEN